MNVFGKLRFGVCMCFRLLFFLRVSVRLMVLLVVMCLWLRFVCMLKFLVMLEKLFGFGFGSGLIVSWMGFDVMGKCCSLGCEKKFLECCLGMGIFIIILSGLIVSVFVCCGYSIMCFRMWVMYWVLLWSLCIVWVLYWWIFCE